MSLNREVYLRAASFRSRVADARFRPYEWDFLASLDGSPVGKVLETIRIDESLLSEFIVEQERRGLIVAQRLSLVGYLAIAQPSTARALDAAVSGGDVHTYHPTRDPLPPASDAKPAADEPDTAYAMPTPINKPMPTLLMSAKPAVESIPTSDVSDLLDADNRARVTLAAYSPIGPTAEAIESELTIEPARPTAPDALLFTFSAETKPFWASRRPDADLVSQRA